MTHVRHNSIFTYAMSDFYEFPISSINLRMYLLYLSQRLGRYYYIFNFGVFFLIFLKMLFIFFNTILFALFLNKQPKLEFKSDRKKNA